MSDWGWWIVAGVLLVASAYFAVRDRPYVYTRRYTASATLSVACAVTAAVCVLAAVGVAP